MAFYNKLVLTNIGESTLTEVLSSGRNLLLSELRLSADVYNQTEIKNLVSLTNAANIIATSSVILDEETSNFIISGSFSNKDITESLTINSIGLYSTLDNKIKLIGVATAIEPIIIKPFQNAVNFYNLKLSLALKQSEHNAIVIIDDLKSDRVVLRNLVTNGDFRDGTEGWLTTRGSIRAESKTVYFKPTLINWNTSLDFNTDYISGNKYYIYLEINRPDDMPIDMYIGEGSTGNMLIQKNQWERHSRIITSSVNGKIKNRIILNCQNLTLESEIMLRNILSIDLTATFGAGNEPTKEWMDRLIEQSGYFDEYILNENWQVGEISRLSDTKANKAQEDWITPTLLNGWYAIRASEPPQYMKDEFGFVHFRGCISKGASATSNVAFQLPTGYRPDVSTTFGIPEININSKSIATSIFVGGSVDFAGASLNTWYGISYITFKAV